MPGLNEIRGDGKRDVIIWSGIEEPAFQLAEKSVFINDSINKEFLVMFDQPISVSGPFFVGYDLDDTPTADKWAVYQASSNGGDNTLMLKTLTGWEDYDVISGDVPSLAWIEVLVGDVIYTDSVSVELPSENFMVVPNPVVQDLTIYYPEDGAGTVTIYNLNGQPVYERNVLIYNNRCKLTAVADLLQAGTYLIQMDMGGKKSVRKLMVR